ncbi:thymine dioxygenase [Mycena olivaceomarginata]|nr:thymine dioxygenase [Mycena olivaceomarginata]
MDEGTLNASAIPIIDFGPFLDGSNKHEVAGKMVSSFKEIGFVYLMNHGIPTEKSAEMFEWSKRFFAQPMEVKKLAPHPPSGAHHRGYSSPGQEKVVQHVYHPDAIAEQRAQAPDVKESFECGRERTSCSLISGCLTAFLPGFKEACLNFFWDYFLQYHTNPENQLRLLHYPSVPAEALETEKIARIGQHSDFGSITLLLQDDVGGLEVEDPNVAGSFCPRPIPGALVVNAGSNDTIRSTIHRVRAPPQNRSVDGMTPERYSIPYDFSTVVDCIPGTWSAERPKKYEPISAQEYIMKRMAATY